MPCYLRGSLKITNTQRFIELARQNHWSVIQEGDKLILQQGVYTYKINTSELESLPTNRGNVVGRELLNGIIKQYTLDTIKTATRLKGWTVSSIKEEGNTLKVRIRS